MRLDGSARFMRLFERDDAPRVWVLSIISPLSLHVRTKYYEEMLKVRFLVISNMVYVA